jgi:hypothetical protein
VQAIVLSCESCLLVVELGTGIVSSFWKREAVQKHNAQLTWQFEQSGFIADVSCAIFVLD